MSNFPKISVLMITYNQHNTIGRAIDSVLIQKEYVHEIVICDDCSTDNNWDVILEYKSRYPNLIRPFRNEHNLGIFGNIENTWTKPTGDAIIFLSGDDTICNGLFVEMSKCIDRYDIDLENELYCLYCDFRVIYPKRWHNLFAGIFGRNISNKLIEKGFDPISLKVRGLIVNRTVIYSRKILDKFTPVSKDLGIFADGLIDIQVQQYADSNYYFPFVGSEYYSGIGVSVKTIKSEASYSRHLLAEEYKKEFNLSDKDIAWLDFIDARNDFFLHMTWQGLFRIMSCHWRSVECKYGFRGLQLRQFAVDCYYMFRSWLKFIQ